MSSARNRECPFPLFLGMSVFAVVLALIALASKFVIHLRYLFSLLFVASLLVACGGVLNPPQGPGTDYSCSYWEHRCSPESGGGCCRENEVCGHDRWVEEDPMGSCFVGFCCYVGERSLSMRAQDGLESTPSSAVPRELGRVEGSP